MTSELSMVSVSGWTDGTVFGVAAAWASTVFDISVVIIAVALVVTVLVWLVIALAVRKLVGKVGELVDHVQDRIDPVMKHVQDVGDNVNYISTAIRGDVQQLNQTITRANERVNEVVTMAEERVQSLNALITVVQEEAEDIFIETASTVRGLRAGADALRRPNPRAAGESRHTP